MRRIGLAASIAVLVGIIVVGTVVAAGGLGDLARFSPSGGTSHQRLTKIETFLADQSRVLTTELPRIQNQLDGVTAVVQPATCPTDAEAAYLADLDADIEALADAFDAMSSTTDLDAIVAVAVAVFERVPPPSIRGQVLHVESRRLSVSTMEIVTAMEMEIADSADAADAADALDRLKPGITRWAVELVMLTYLVGQFCDGSPPTAAAAPTATTRTPSVTRTPTARATVTRTPSPTATAQHPLVKEFGCQWIMDTYRPAAILGRDLAIQSLATSMSVKRLESGTFSFIGPGDVAPALRECEARGFK